MISTGKFLSAAPFFSHLSSAPVCALHGLHFLQEYPAASACGPPWTAVWISAPTWSLPWTAQGTSALASWSTPSSSELGVPFAVSHSFCSPPPRPVYCFLTFPKYISAEVPSSWLMGSAVPCGGSILDCVWHRAATDLLSQRPPLQSMLAKS